MSMIHHHLRDNATAVPLSPSLIATGIDLKSCSYFPSNTVPMKIVFSTASNNNHATKDNDDLAKRNSADAPLPLYGNMTPVIFKVGDDLRQDQLTLQMIRVMDKLWLREGLDLKIVTFACVATGENQGILEMVTEAKTLREIQVSKCVLMHFNSPPL